MSYNPEIAQQAIVYTHTISLSLPLSISSTHTCYNVKLPISTENPCSNERKIKMSKT